MRLCFVVLFCTITVCRSIAQNGYGSTSVYDRVIDLPKDKHFFIITPTAIWRKQPWRDSVYQFDSFGEGHLEMTNGFVPSHKLELNYNIFVETMELKSKDGTITTLEPANEIKAIFIGNHKFVYEPSFGYIEIILEGKASLGRKIYMKGSYELDDGSRSLLGTADVKTLPARFTRYYWLDVRYFIIGENQKTFRPGKTALPRLFPNVKKQVKAFSVENNINYSREEDLLKIIRYANELAGI
ncbi:MAG TPA: hypothetical protein VF473_01755 [Cyclobacteriaceae bacterium]